MSATTGRQPRIEDPVGAEALLIRHQEAIDILNYPEAHGLDHELPCEQRESLLAAVVWPSPALLAWSVERARAKLEHRLAGG